MAHTTSGGTAEHAACEVWLRAHNGRGAASPSPSARAVRPEPPVRASAVVTSRATGVRHWALARASAQPKQSASRESLSAHAPSIMWEISPGTGRRR